jgi:hypothetical protein
MDVSAQLSCISNATQSIGGIVQRCYNLGWALVGDTIKLSSSVGNRLACKSWEVTWSLQARNVEELGRLSLKKEATAASR